MRRRSDKYGGFSSGTDSGAGGCLQYPGEPTGLHKEGFPAGRKWLDWLRDCTGYHIGENIKKKLRSKRRML